MKIIFLRIRFFPEQQKKWDTKKPMKLIFLIYSSVALVNPELHILDISLTYKLNGIPFELLKLSSKKSNS